MITKATLGSVMGYSKKKQLEMLKTYPLRISQKRIRQNGNEGEEDGSWNEAPKRMYRLVPTLCSVLFVNVVVWHYGICE